MQGLLTGLVAYPAVQLLKISSDLQARSVDDTPQAKVEDRQLQLVGIAYHWILSLELTGCHRCLPWGEDKVKN